MSEDDMKALLERNHITMELSDKETMQQCIANIQRD